MSKFLNLLCSMTIVCFFIVMTGCAHSPGGIAASSTPLEGKQYTSLGYASGTDSAIYILGLIPVSGSNTTKEALNAAIKSKNGDAMVNVTVEGYAQWWVVFTRVVTQVEGEVIKFQ